MVTESIRADLNAVVLEIWSSMANVELKCSQEPGGAEKQCGVVVSSVQLVGVWNGAVQLEMDEEFARGTTSRMIGIDAMEVPQDAIRDAAGELANMVGGGLKALLPPDCMLSLPSVVMGRDFEFGIPQGSITAKYTFRSECGDMKVLVIERQRTH